MAWHEWQSLSFNSFSTSAFSRSDFPWRPACRPSPDMVNIATIQMMNAPRMQVLLLTRSSLWRVELHSMLNQNGCDVRVVRRDYVGYPASERFSSLAGLHRHWELILLS